MEIILEETHGNASGDACGLFFRGLLSLPFRFPGRRTEEYALSERQSTDASDRAVDSRRVFVRMNDRFHYFWRGTCCVGIKVYHRAANVAHRYGDGGRVFLLAE